MSSLKDPPRMKFFMAAFGPDPEALNIAIDTLSSDFCHGILKKPDLISKDLSLSETSYYEKEMGPGLIKRYLSWEPLLKPDLLVDLKLMAMDLEKKMAKGEHRLVNLDPGYIFAGGLILSTAKFTGHRLYLGRGIWGELTLHFHRGHFEAQKWTYRDYQRPEVINLLTTIREKYIQTLNEDKLHD